MDDGLNRRPMDSSESNALGDVVPDGTLESTTKQSVPTFERPEQSGYRPVLTVDLEAVCHNYRILTEQNGTAKKSGAVIKADAYGAGAMRISRALATREGCQTFFVVHPHEGILLRQTLVDCAPDATIYVFAGPTKATLRLFKSGNLSPVLNSLEQCRLWADVSDGAAAALHVNTGMNRLGLPVEDIPQLKTISDLTLDLILTHLSSADEPEQAINDEQRVLFKDVAKAFEGIPKSLSATAGALLSANFQSDMHRPGIGLFGVDPSGRFNIPLHTALTLHAEILQVQTLPAGSPVGYNGTFTTKRETTLATLALGYADGFPIAASNRAKVFISGEQCDVIGRVSMDLTTIDVTDLPNLPSPGDNAEVFGTQISVVDLASACNTIPYEIFTRMSSRVYRNYIR